MNDQSGDPRVTAYVLDAMEPEEKRAFETELESDSALKAQVEKRRALVSVIVEAFEAEPQLPSEGHDQLRHELEKRGPTRIEYLMIISVILVVFSVLGRGLKDKLPQTMDEVFKGVNAKIKQLRQAGMAN